MPKLRRMRLCGIGHDSARFDDVTLNFTDRHGHPTNSVLWLRNGGGKTSLLSLFFAGVRPNKREFLGQRADEKVRRIEDYVGPQDHGAVICEWELDSERGLFNDSAPLYLSGVFYQRKDTNGGADDSDVDRLFFATLVSAKEPDLTLDGLPLFTDSTGNGSRRTLSGFRRRLRQLDQEHPDRNVFVEDKNQTKFEDELASHGIDPQVFLYQIRMNEREGGVTQLFSFASDEDFADFLLEMTFDQRHARQVREQLGTFRQEIVERNEQLKPELEYCQGLIVRLHKLAGIAQERTEIFRKTANAQAMLHGLNAWSLERRATLQTDQKREEARLVESKQTASSERELGDMAQRLAAVHHRQGCRIHLQQQQAEYDVSEQMRLKAKRQKEIGQAAVPLARVWDARREAGRFRDLLQQKLNEFQPQLLELTEVATSLANALDHDVGVLRDAETLHRQEAQRLRTSADQARKDAASAGERAAQDEKQTEHLQSQLRQYDQEKQLLHTKGVLADGETVAVGLARHTRDIDAQSAAIVEQEVLVEDVRKQLADNLSKRTEAEASRSAVETEQARASEGWERAVRRRTTLESDATLLRLLQTDQVDVEVAATAAAAQASDELRRVTDAILRISVEAAEDERAINGLAETSLLPPSSDVESLLNWLRQHNITCWSGWDYLQSNVTLRERRTVIRRVPQIAAGVVVANAEYDRVVDLLCSTEVAHGYRSRSPLVVAPADALTDNQFGTWVVVGPTSDAHFDKGAGAEELNRLLKEKTSRQREVEGCQVWRDALSDLKHRLHEFQTDFPRGWFNDHRQKLEIIASRLEDAQQLVQRLLDQNQALESEIEASRQRIRFATDLRHELLRALDQLNHFDRTFEQKHSAWQTELAHVRDRAEKARHLQVDLLGKVSAWEEREQQALQQAGSLTIQAAQVDLERSKVKYVDHTLRKAAAGQTDDLRGQYELLRSDYEGQVRADALSHLAEAKDRDADKEDREFQRILAGLPHLTADEVIAELQQLPAGVTPQQQLELADKALDVANGRLGPLKGSLKAAATEADIAERACTDLSQTGALPELVVPEAIERHQALADEARAAHRQHLQLAEAFELEVGEIDNRITSILHENEKLERDLQRLGSLRSSNERQFERLMSASRENPLQVSVPAISLRDSALLVDKLNDLERNLIQTRDAQEALDARRDAAGKDISHWSRHDKFTKLRSSVSHRFQDRDAAAMEAKADFDILQLHDCVFQVEEKLKEADKQREIVIHVLASAVDEALGLLTRVSRMSKLPESLPKAGKQFLKIETKASDNPTERRTYIGELIDELLERGDVGDGLQLVQKAVRRVARRISVRVLHPDLHQETDRVSIAQLRGFSGGERLTSAILLYCALIRLRHSESQRRGASSVLILDNPIGTASRLSFLDMQREVAKAMNVQLVYATAVKDISAVGALENIIRLRNSRADRRTGRRFIEAEVNGEDAGAGIDAARVVFHTPPSSLIRQNGQTRDSESEVSDDARHS